MARFTIAADLEAKLARMVTPHIVKVAGEVERAAKDLAPSTKDWVSMHDPLVRRQHEKADREQTGIPDNLRFTLDSFAWDREHRGVGPDSYLRFPRDQSSRCFVQLVNCRCTVRVDKDGIAKLIKTERPLVSRSKVTVKVVCEGKWVVASEFGTVYPGGLVAEGAHFMAGAAARVRAQRRARR